VAQTTKVVTGEGGTVPLYLGHEWVSCTGHGWWIFVEHSRIIIERGELKCLERNLCQCHFMPYTSHVEDTEAKHELKLGLCYVKLENKCLSLWLGQSYCHGWRSAASNVKVELRMRNENFKGRSSESFLRRCHKTCLNF